MDHEISQKFGVAEKTRIGNEEERKKDQQRVTTSS
jgi:hypothetical protein